MKALWFEVTAPSRYKKNSQPIAGWQDSLEEIVRTTNEIELSIAFISAKKTEIKIIDGITYIPMFTQYSILEKRKSHYTWEVEEKKNVRAALNVIEKCKPDIIHVFGTEWPFGLIAKYTKVPVVLHIQGAMMPLYNALYPPKYNEYTFFRAAGLHVKKLYHFMMQNIKEKSRRNMEQRIWESVHHFMGRTVWDKSLVGILHPGASYHLVNEALRPIVYNSTERWHGFDNKKLKIFTIGCYNFWKGPDVILKTARILKNIGIDFEWHVAGQINEFIKNVIEYKEKMFFAENNVEIIGFTKPKEIIEYLCNCSMYVHTSYIENSPNSICEAQVLGVPVISTMVGGVETLVRNNIDGVLVPANDPWRLAYEIIELNKDKERMMSYSDSSLKFARERHCPENILSALLGCYKEIIK